MGELLPYKRNCLRPFATGSPSPTQHLTPIALSFLANELVRGRNLLRNFSASHPFA
ncbi:MAG: hypothetical protein IPL78_35620 [Chloroflexi bacterium]|nr:hypothetical protein [Chloroflexota bacterium]